EHVKVWTIQKQNVKLNCHCVAISCHFRVKNNIYLQCALVTFSGSENPVRKTKVAHYNDFVAIGS
ncbi:hypothetical protein ACYBAG_26580, partial [Klebsiella pneumoniae]